MTPTAYRIFALVLSIVVLAFLYFIVSRLVRLYFQFRGTRIVECPDTKEPAAVEVDALRATVSSIGLTELRLKDCSRWPEKQNCGQACLADVGNALNDCLLRTIIARWYAGKACAICGSQLPGIDWLHHKPALLSPEHSTLDWTAVPAEKIPGMLTTHKPICWNCHIAATFRQQHPEMVVDRPWKKA